MTAEYELNNRLALLIRFYRVVENCEKRLLEDTQSRLTCPRRGVYLFFEQGEQRRESGNGLRVVRVGTHGVSQGSKSTLRGRLSSHRGNVKTGRGNHRASVFRLLIGEALGQKYPEIARSTWGCGNSAPAEIKLQELDLEQTVSEYIRRMPFVVVAADDTPSSTSIRAYIERNSIALLSNYNRSEKGAIDAPSPDWLGRFSNRSKVRESGLWNNRHVEQHFDPDFIEALEQLVRQMA